jgi:hypothetical protein
MAINFPTTPSNGQIYTYNGRTWVYNSTNTAWAAQAQNTPGYYSQTTAPTGVKEGDEWYDESTGIFYRYVYDGDTYQWVEVGPAALSFAASDTVAGGIEIADQSEMEASSSTTLAVTPGRMHFHPSVSKTFGLITFSGGTPTNSLGRNIASFTDNGAGDVTVNFTTSFSAATYIVLTGVEESAAANPNVPTVKLNTRAVGSVRLENWRYNFGAKDDGPMAFSILGDF